MQIVKHVVDAHKKTPRAEEPVAFFMGIVRQVKIFFRKYLVSINTMELFISYLHSRLPDELYLHLIKVRPSRSWLDLCVYRL